MERASAIRSYRQQHSLSLEALSAHLGVNKTTFMRWEDGTVLIPTDRVLDVEKATGISRHLLRPDLSKMFTEMTEEAVP